MSVAFVDLHTHVLPDLDDGPATVEGSLAMLRRAHRGGTRVVVATPHMFLPPFDNWDPDHLQRRFEAFAGELALLESEPGYGFLTEMTVLPGAENVLSAGFLEALERRRVVTLGGGRYLLIEFGPYQSLDMALRALRRVIDAGYVPVIAHAERYPFLRGGRGDLAELRRLGVEVQVNSSSVTGASGRRTARAVRTLLRRGLAGLVASDAHNDSSRPADLAPAFAELARRFSETAALEWMWENPRRVAGL